MLLKKKSDCVTSLCGHSYTFLHSPTLRDQDNRTMYTLCECWAPWWKYCHSHCCNFKSTLIIEWCDSQLEPQTRFKSQIVAYAVEPQQRHMYVDSTSCVMFLLHYYLTRLNVFVLFERYKMDLKNRYCKCAFFSPHTFRPDFSGRVYFYTTASCDFLFFDHEDQISKDK